ncbi:MAG: diguanylate cyclase [Pseudomonadota bacterium]
MADDGFNDQTEFDPAARLALAVASSGAGIWDRDFTSGRISYSRAWKAMLGYAEHEVSNRIEDSYQRVHPDDLAMVQAKILAHMENRTPVYEVQHRLRCKDGSYIWVQSRGKVAARDPQGKALRMTGITTDITETIALSEQLRQNVELLTNLTDEIPGLVFQYCEPAKGVAHFPYASAGITDIYGTTPARAAITASVVESVIHPEDLDLYRVSLAESAASLERWHLEFRVLLPMGERWCQGDARPRRLPDGGTLWHGFVSDITERKHIEQQLLEAAATDFLTGVPNRRHLMMCMEKELARLERDGHGGSAVLMLDLDHFKYINDRHGHAVGDDVLKHFAAILRLELRKVDAVGRIGGEEFAAVLSGASLAQATAFGERVRMRMAAAPLRSGGRSIPVTVSIGIATMRPGDGNIANALSRADTALYRAKAAGRDRIETTTD